MGKKKNGKGLVDVSGLETMEEMQERHAKAILTAGVPTEKEMREAEAAHPKTSAELAAYVEGLMKRPHDYGTCVYAMSMAAVAAFNLVAHELGVTGFQASCADLDILRRIRRIEHGFSIVDVEKLLYPQYDPIGDVRKFLRERVADLKSVAEEKLKTDGKQAHPDVRKRWKAIAEGTYTP